MKNEFKKLNKKIDKLIVKVGPKRKIKDTKRYIYLKKKLIKLQSKRTRLLASDIKQLQIQICNDL